MGRELMQELVEPPSHGVAPHERRNGLRRASSAVRGMPRSRALIRVGARCLGLEVTAGINTGAVYVGPVGSARHHETMIMGPAVGLAARLQGLAQPGQILVSEATQRLTRHAFEFTPLTLEIKGL